MTRPRAYWQDGRGWTFTPPTSHSPGPWETSPDAVPDGHTQVTVYAERDGERVATVFRTEGNARLIAAAPDLLAAAQEALRVLVNADLPWTPDEESAVEGLHQALRSAGVAEPLGGVVPS